MGIITTTLSGCCDDFNVIIFAKKTAKGSRSWQVIVQSASLDSLSPCSAWMLGICGRNMTHRNSDLSSRNGEDCDP